MVRRRVLDLCSRRIIIVNRAGRRQCGAIHIVGHHDFTECPQLHRNLPVRRSRRITRNIRRRNCRRAPTRLGRDRSGSLGGRCPAVEFVGLDITPAESIVEKVSIRVANYIIGRKRKNRSAIALIIRNPARARNRVTLVVTAPGRHHSHGAVGVVGREKAVVGDSCRLTRTAARAHSNGRILRFPRHVGLFIQRPIAFVRKRLIRRVHSHFESIPER